MIFATVIDYTLPAAPFGYLMPDGGMSPGTLLLADCRHPAGGFTTPNVVPTAGTIPNVAREVAALRTGGVAANMDLPLIYTRSAGDASLRVERTARGGVHVVSSQVGQTSGTDAWGIDLPSALDQYILDAIPGGALYFSMWCVRTRAEGAGNTTPMSNLMYSSHATSNPLGNTIFRAENLIPPAAVANLGRTPVAIPAIGTPVLVAGAVSAWTGTKPASISTVRSAAAIIGRAYEWATANVNKASSLVWYRSKIEDLRYTSRAHGGTGGTPAEEFATALAKDQAMFAAAFGAGGDLHGDTWTTPQTLLP